MQAVHTYLDILVGFVAIRFFSGILVGRAIIGFFNASFPASDVAQSMRGGRKTAENNR